MSKLYFKYIEYIGSNVVEQEWTFLQSCSTLRRVESGATRLSHQCLCLLLLSCVVVIHCVFKVQINFLWFLSNETSSLCYDIYYFPLFTSDSDLKFFLLSTYFIILLLQIDYESLHNVYQTILTFDFQLQSSLFLLKFFTVLVKVPNISLD